MEIQPDETLITGSWIFVNGRMVEDAAQKRINALSSGLLERIAETSGGWEILYRDPRDGRYWEKTFPHSGMHGGGPASLRALDGKTIREKYGFEPK
jgi:hypothetical protein